MISMAEKMYIKQLYEDGVSKSEIQRRTKVNYRTVCKYADMEDWNDDKLPNMEPDNYPVLGEYIPLINEWLCRLHTPWLMLRLTLENFCAVMLMETNTRRMSLSCRSRTNTKHRNGFNQMIADALAGKIDLIITKSVSRFARNTVDSLSTIRKLKEHNIECYFEKENIKNG